MTPDFLGQKIYKKHNIKELSHLRAKEVINKILLF